MYNFWVHSGQIGACIWTVYMYKEVAAAPVAGAWNADSENVESNNTAWVFDVVR